MIKLSLRENMKSFTRFLLVAMCIVPFGANCAPVPSTRGNNLTAYNGASGVTNNNNWNALMNVRSGSDSADMPVADFGNCNAVILRCASPKCANGGCTSMDVTSTIVSGCVRSNETCAKYGDELVQYISAQLVASSTAKANAAQNAAAAAAAQQSAQQMQQMQAQMQQMQSQMAQQNAETVAQLQDALEEQKQLTAQAIADAAAARETAAQNTVAASTTTATTNTNSTDAQAAGAGALTAAQQLAAQSGVSADILAREQISGQIMSEIENAEANLTTLKATMTDVFNYAGCDSKGDNCTGPKRVRAFKEKAMAFFDPYEEVLGELYDALILAQSVGVDITDIYMMLNDSCNVWGKYMCERDQELRYTRLNCIKGVSVPYRSVIGGANCVIGKIIPPTDGGCQPLGSIPDGETVRYNWLNPEEGDSTLIRVGCMSDMLESSTLFRNRKKGASIDIETLKRIIEQDAPTVYGTNSLRNSGTTPKVDGLKFCAVNDTTLAELEKIVSLKTLPEEICVTDTRMEGIYTDGYSVTSEDSVNYKKYASGASSNTIVTQSQINCENANGTWLVTGCNCPAGQKWDYNNNKCVINGTNLTASAVLGGGTSSVAQFNNTTQNIKEYDVEYDDYARKAMSNFNNTMNNFNISKIPK